jgi:Zn ribbon nucleic-acid-binding protein
MKADHSHLLLEGPGWEALKSEGLPLSGTKDEIKPERKCVRCGCTDAAACYDKVLGMGCCWTDIEDVCSACLTTDEFNVWAEKYQII